MVGVGLVEALVVAGHEVRALVRDPATAEHVAGLGARPVFGDLTEERGTWRPHVAGAGQVWHLAQPRVPVTLRGVRARRLGAQAAEAASNLAAVVEDGATVVAASTVHVWGDRPGVETHDGDPPAPVGMGVPALAAERALAGLGVRAVRFGWVYGPGGFAPGLLRALRARRFRIVGDGGNHMPLLHWRDAVAALLAARDLPPGAYAAAEAPVPTQREVVEGLCARLGVRRTDSLPVRMASLSLGGAMARAMSASCRPSADGLRSAGWSPAHLWTEDLIPAVEPGAASGRGGGR
jgi:nucleoside-diphosphate-sugar epimerase